MIINMRGTGGSGKSYIVRAVMARCAETMPRSVAGRRRPIGYDCRLPNGDPLFVPGHYETPCGGCDTIKTPDEAYALITAAAEAGAHVVFEGIIVQDDVRRMIEIASRHPVLVLALQVPIDECLNAIRFRRAARGDSRALNPRNTVARVRRLEGTMRRLREAGVDARWADRVAALAQCLEALGIEGDAIAQPPEQEQLALW
ncbi:MAG: hypothetical protein ABIH03_11035 [Pseudomonadota bacterium]